MLEEWGQAIQEAISERDRLRTALSDTQRALHQAMIDKALTEKKVRDLSRALAEEQQEHRATLNVNGQMRHDLEGTQTLYREATEAIMGLRSRIRFLEDIAHSTGHIVRCGGTP